MTQTQAAKPVIGVLLVHGFNGSKRDFAEMEMLLQQQGMITHNMVLPGHGTHVKNMLATGWKDWAEAVRVELNDLKQRCDFVFIVGHSLGGSLALHAAAWADVDGVVAMCAPIRMYPITHWLVWSAKFFTPLLPGGREDVRDPAARRRYTRDVYTWTPMRPVESLLLYLPTLRAELKRITAPALIMTSIWDHVVPARDGREIYQLLGSKEKHLVTFHHSYHVIMKDHDREEVFEKTIAFIQRYAALAHQEQIST